MLHGTTDRMGARLIPKIWWLLTVILAGVGGLCAQSPASYLSLEFIENKGQWGDAFDYQAELGSGAFFLHADGFTVLAHDTADYRRVTGMLHGHGSQAGASEDLSGAEGLRIHSHAYRVRFVGAGPARSVAEGQLQTGISYFLGDDPARWQSGLSSWQSVTYRDVYPGIDVRYYTLSGRLKYDIIVHPGADPAQVKLRYEGIEGLAVDKGELHVHTSVGDIRELSPYTYEVKDGSRRELRCRYRVKGHEMAFDVQGHDRGARLVIDPTIVFSTFTGSTADNWGFTATPGLDGSFFAGGIVFGNGYPATLGAISRNYLGASVTNPASSVNIGITRFSPDGRSRLYSTYLGGSGFDIPHSLIADPEGNLVLLGRTTSFNYPSLGYVSPSRGSTDIVVTKINATGTALIGSAILGGSGQDGMNIDPNFYSVDCNPMVYNYGDNARSEVVLDDAGNVLFVSSAQSANFPMVNAVQPTRGGSQDAVVVKMTPTLSSVLFSTYLGGSGNDAGFCIKVHPRNGDIYVAGPTLSTNFPGDHSGTLGLLHQGDIDGYVTILKPDGSGPLRSTYLGTPQIDIIYGLHFDASGYPYVMGISQGSWPVLNASAFYPNARQFISKLRPDLSGYEFSTVFGSSSSVPNISPVAFLVDRCENLYVSGWGGQIDPCSTPGCYDRRTAGPAGMYISPDGRPTRDNRDFYFIVLEKNAARVLYASCFGQTGGGTDHVDGGTSRFDSRGFIYQSVCANCGRNDPCSGSPPAPVTAAFPVLSAVAPSNLSSNCNLAAVKIAFDFDGVKASLQVAIDGDIRDTSGCLPLKVDFKDTIGTAKSYEWEFNDGSPRVTTTVPSYTHTFNRPGFYRVMLIGKDPTKCIQFDTVYRNIRVGIDKAVPDFLQEKLLPCTLLAYRFDNRTPVIPGKPFSPQSFVWDFGDGSPRVVSGLNAVSHTFPAPGSYTVKLLLTDTLYCNTPDSVSRSVSLGPNILAGFTMSKDTTCTRAAIQFTNTSVGGITYTWDFGDGTGHTGTTAPAKVYDLPGTYVVTLVGNAPATCNLTDTIRKVIRVFGPPKADFSYLPLPSQENMPTRFINTSTGATRYLWDLGDGSSSVELNPVRSYQTTGLQKVCLQAINVFNCRDTLCQPVASIVTEKMDVPTAFSPNGDGVNDRVYARVFGIRSMSFRIYNRWGQAVFQSSNPDIGWDGIFQGKLQPMDVYGYVLDVEFITGRRATKRGDITLLR
ncbi:MAG: PKD domain-containing protein [Bacteroidetes bacterium]|nr:PKD domain-containing protein [Bacteroidota bacterium]